MSQRNRPAVGVYMCGIVRKAERAHYRQPLRRERFIQFDHADVADLEAQSIEQLFGRRRRTDPHDPRLYARHRPTQHSGAWRKAIFFDCGLRRYDQRCGTVIDSAGIAGGD